MKVQEVKNFFQGIRGHCCRNNFNKPQHELSVKYRDLKVCVLSEYILIILE